MGVVPVDVRVESPTRAWAELSVAKLPEVGPHAPTINTLADILSLEPTDLMGVAAAPARDDEVAKTLLARADEALYVAKRNGRDRAVVWHAGMRAFDGAAHGRARHSTPSMIRAVE